MRYLDNFEVSEFKKIPSPISDRTEVKEFQSHFRVAFFEDTWILTRVSMEAIVTS